MNQFRWPNAELDGSYYAMPWDSGPVVMYYRRDVFEAAGLSSEPADVSEMVSTWEGYLETCQTINAETGLQCFNQSRANNDARLFEKMLWEAGSGYYDESGEVIVNSEQHVEMLETLGTFFEEGLVNDVEDWTDPWYASFAEVLEDGGSPVATHIGASWMDIFYKDWIAPGTEGLWGVARMPGWTEDSARAANDGGSAFVIPEQSDNKEAAWAFIEYTLGRVDSQVSIFEVSGFIPALESAYEHPIFEESDDFFAGQNTREVYADVVSEIPEATIYGPNYAAMNNSVGLAMQLYLTGEMGAQEALNFAAEEIYAVIE
jgi:ABC-type glycerol-3-phosphate transport system substrate-binding protein